MIELWENETRSPRATNAQRPLTRSLDLREEGLAMQATQICSISDCDRPHFGKGLCQRHLESKRRADRRAGAAGSCTINDCGDPAMSRGWCEGHYRRWLDHGNPAAGRRSPVGGTCSVSDCDRPSKAQTWCKLHYYRWKRTGDLADPTTEVKLCSLDGCDRKHQAHGWCRLHAERFWRTGDPLTVFPSSRDLRGPLSPNWQGRDVTYQGAHSRVRQLRGKAVHRNCVDCKGPATQWSYDHVDPDELVEPDELGRKHYSAKPEHYQPRCNSCHTLFDNRVRR